MAADDDLGEDFSDRSIFLGTAAGEYPTEVSATVFHFSKKGSLFVLLSSDEQLQQSMITTKRVKYFSIAVWLVIAFKAITSLLKF
jgi:hypothetical protein